MLTGEIYFWVTDKASGHWTRPKWHVYMCPPDWRDEHMFLFVNSQRYGDDYPISNTDYKFFPNAISYISCGGTVSYSDDELKAAKPRLDGRLTQKHMMELHDAVWASDTLEQWKIIRACEALKAAC